MPEHFTISVGDEAVLSVEEIWPDGNAPADPTIEEVIAELRRQGKGSIERDWGFDFHVEVNGRNVF